MICSYYVTNSVKRVKVKELFHRSLCLLVKLDDGTWIFHCHTFFFCACLKIQFQVSGHVVQHKYNCVCIGQTIYGRDAHTRFFFVFFKEERISMLFMRG